MSVSYSTKSQEVSPLSLYEHTQTLNMIGEGGKVETKMDVVYMQAQPFCFAPSFLFQTRNLDQRDS